jgi:hypothetical protein
MQLKQPRKQGWIGSCWSHQCMFTQAIGKVCDEDAVQSG